MIMALFQKGCEIQYNTEIHVLYQELSFPILGNLDHS